MAQQAAFGTILKVFDVLTDYTFDAVAYVRTISAPGLGLESLDTSGHDASGGNNAAVGGMLDAGELSLDIAWDPSNATHDLLSDLMANRKFSIFQLIWPDDEIDNYRGFVVGFEPGAPFDQLLTATVQIRMSGNPLLKDSIGFSWLATEGGDVVKQEGGGLILMEF
jgi:predicted secreted protein